MEPRDSDSDQMHRQYHSRHNGWEINHFAHQGLLEVLTSLLTLSQFNDAEKVEICERLNQQEVHHKHQQEIEEKINRIREALPLSTQK